MRAADIHVGESYLLQKRGRFAPAACKVVVTKKSDDIGRWRIWCKTETSWTPVVNASDIREPWTKATAERVAEKARQKAEADRLAQERNERYWAAHEVLSKSGFSGALRDVLTLAKLVPTLTPEQVKILKGE